MWGNCIPPGPFGRQIIIDVPNDSPGPVKQIANVVMKPGGDENKVVRMALDVVRTSGAAPGNIKIGFWQQMDLVTKAPMQPHTFTFFEEWQTVADATRDNDSPEVARFIDATKNDVILTIPPMYLQVTTPP